MIEQDRPDERDVRKQRDGRPLEGRYVGRRRRLAEDHAKEEEGETGREQRQPAMQTQPRPEMTPKVKALNWAIDKKAPPTAISAPDSMSA